MQWLKRTTACLLAFLLCAVWVSAQNGSASSAGGGNGSAIPSANDISNAGAPAVTSDASVGPSASNVPRPPTASGSSSSSSGRSSSIDPYSPFDAGNGNVNLRHLLADDPEPPAMSVM